MTLREYRLEHGLTQETFGRLIGRTAATVSRIETGKLGCGWETLAKIEAVTCGTVTTDDLRRGLAA